jgi:hypothetical protein
MSVNKERAALVRALVRLTTTSEAFLETVRGSGLVASGCVSETLLMRMNEALGESRVLLASLPPEEPVVVETLNEDGAMSSRIERT